MNSNQQLAAIMLAILLGFIGLNQISIQKDIRQLKQEKISGWGNE